MPSLLADPQVLPTTTSASVSLPKPASGTPSYRVSVSDTLASFESLAEAWAALLNTLFHNQPSTLVVVRHDWFCHYLQTFPAKQPYIILVWDGDNRLVGALPLQLRCDATTAHMNTLQFIGSSPLLFDQMPWLIPPGEQQPPILEAIVAQLMRDKALWEMIDLSLMTDTLALQRFNALMAQHIILTQQEQDAAPYLPLDDRWKTAPPSKNLKSNLNRFRNRLKRDFPDHTLNLKYYAPGPEADAVLAAFESRHIAYWKARHINSFFKQWPHLMGFFKQLLALTVNEPQCSLVLSTLNIDDNQSSTPLCYEWGMIHNHTYLCYIRAYAPDFERYSPGTLHHHYLIQQLLNEGRISAFDFGRGREAYKYRWTTDEVMLYQLRGFKNGWIQKRWQLVQFQRHGLKAIKQQVRRYLNSHASNSLSSPQSPQSNQDE